MKTFSPKLVVSRSLNVTAIEVALGQGEGLLVGLGEPEMGVWFGGKTVLVAVA